MATEVDSVFFSISSADAVSKWFGESEQLVKYLFEMARAHKPADIFIDEIDSLYRSRSDWENDSTRQMKTKFLVQMQGGVGINNNGILIMGATNIPWGLDPAIRRRLEKRICIPLPDENARRCMFDIHMGNTSTEVSPNQFSQLAKQTDGYSRADIGIVVCEGLMVPVHKVQMATHFTLARGPFLCDPNSILDDLLTPCGPHEHGAQEMNWMQVEGDKLLEPRVTLEDFKNSLLNTY